MITINLLPQELKKKQQGFKVPDVTVAFLPIAAGIIGLLILAHAALGFTAASKKGAHARMEKEWNRILPGKRKVEVLKQEVMRMQTKVDVIDELMVKRILWSRKLNELSNSMIQGIWLTKLSLTKAGDAEVLNIEGSASSTYGDETATVGKFIESLKANKNFFMDFSGVEFEDMQRRAIKDIEVMNFKIRCYFKEEKK